MEPPTRICFGITFVFLVIWIGLFTGLNVPEIKRMDDYLHTQCYVNNSMIIRRYCPTKSCSNVCDSFSGMECPNVMWVIEQIGPDTCNASAPPSLSTCPTDTYCDDGHKCCHKHCTTTGSGDHRHTTCSCDDETDHHRCTIIPTLCYTLRLFLEYNTTDDLQVSTTYDFDTNDNGPKAYELQNVKYQQNHFYSCFYNIHNLALVRWSIAYTEGFWAASGIFAIFAFFGCIVSFGMWINDSSSGGDAAFWHYMNLWFWISIVLGLCLFLPLGLDDHIPEPSRTHLLRLAIVWTTMWSGFYAIYLFVAFDGWLRLQGCCYSLSEKSRECWIGAKEKSGKYVHNAKECFGTNWTALHTWGREKIDNKLNGFFCGCCNWCAATIKYVCKERGQEEEQPPPIPDEDALSGVVVDEFKRPSSYRTAMKNRKMSCREKCLRLWCNTYSSSSSS